MLTDDQIAELEAAHAAATPGPWQTRFLYRSFRAARETAGLLVHAPPEQDWPDAEVACLTHNLLPALLADRRELLARSEAAERERNAVIGLLITKSTSCYESLIPMPNRSDFLCRFYASATPFKSYDDAVAHVRQAAGLSPTGDSDPC